MESNFKTAEHNSWLPTIAIWLGAYEPAVSTEDADRYMTTGEIAALISSHIGQEVPQTAVYQCMLYFEFKYASQGSGPIEWLLKYVRLPE